jgi:hypothetical protein
MDPWMLIVAAGLGAMKMTDLVKQVIPWPLQPWTMSLASLVTASVLCVLLSKGQGAQETILLTMGSAGLASLLHELASALSTKSDDLKQTIMLRPVMNRRR